MPTSMSRHYPTSSTKEVQSSSRTSKSKPIRIPGSSSSSTRSKVILLLPAQTNPPALASSPTHRTAPNPTPVLISASYPGRRRTSSSFGSLGSTSSHSSSTPPGRVTFSLSSSVPKQMQRPTFQGTGPSPSSSMAHQHPHQYQHHTHHGPGLSPPMGSSPPNANRVTVTGSAPRARTTSMDTYTRSTITRGGMGSEDDYYSHPAVRAYEMQKAAEQARWTRHRQMVNAQRQGRV